MIQSVYVEQLRNVGIGSDLIRFVIDESRAMELSYLGLHPSERSVSFLCSVWDLHPTSGRWSFASS